jgi:hypothetical protein
MQYDSSMGVMAMAFVAAFFVSTYPSFLTSINTSFSSLNILDSNNNPTSNGRWYIALACGGLFWLACRLMQDKIGVEPSLLLATVGAVVQYFMYQPNVISSVESYIVSLQTTAPVGLTTKGQFVMGLIGGILIYFAAPMLGLESSGWMRW